MVKASRFGLMAPIMRAIGEMAYCKERGCSTILMGTSIRAPFTRIEPMALALTYMKMVKFMRVIGRMTFTMAKVEKNSQTAQPTKVSLTRAKEKDMACTQMLRMVQYLKVTGMII